MEMKAELEINEAALSISWGAREEPVKVMMIRLASHNASRSPKRIAVWAWEREVAPR